MSGLLLFRDALALACAAPGVSCTARAVAAPDGAPETRERVAFSTAGTAGFSLTVRTNKPGGANVSTMKVEA
jgi:hypothetical protein